jgi:hypothetical protein
MHGAVSAKRITGNRQRAKAISLSLCTDTKLRSQSNAAALFY